MRKKIIVGILGLAVVVVGIAAFSAFTAQIVNLTAHVEKEIELTPCVNASEEVDQIDYNMDTDMNDVVCIEDPAGGDFGTVIPQQEYDKFIELTLSSSFRDSQDQPKFGDVHADILWECKQFDDERDLVDNDTGKPNTDTGDPNFPGDGWPDCRVSPLGLDHNGDTVVDENDLPHDGNLDASLRDYARVITANPLKCLAKAGDSGDPNPDTDPSNDDYPHITAEDPAILPPEKDVEFVGHAELIDLTDLEAKCFYTIRLLAPPCEGEFNPFTDPNGPNVKTIECHFDKPTADPQTWEHFADIGDDFKVQVTFHSLRP
ncbi:MAG: hypothetical protein V3V35_07165 [Dehalococcoidia bacterium]